MGNLFAAQFVGVGFYLFRVKAPALMNAAVIYKLSRHIKVPDRIV
jgi:hypothetical protein